MNKSNIYEIEGDEGEKTYSNLNELIMKNFDLTFFFTLHPFRFLFLLYMYIY